MIRKSTIAAAAAAIALSGGAGAHEFVCEKTVEGEVVHVVDGYPARLHFKVVVTNTHPTDASVALSLRDDLLASLGVDVQRRAPFTLQVGESAEFEAEVTVRSEAACRRLSRAQACTRSFEDAFQVIFDGGVAQCAARLICMPEEAAQRESGR
ncbi:MAG: COG1470 family protein [Myxococcales bacterium]